MLLIVKRSSPSRLLEPVSSICHLTLPMASGTPKISSRAVEAMEMMRIVERAVGLFEN